MKYNIIDRAIAYVNPRAGYLRMQIRGAMDMQRKYDAAARGRGGKNWFAPGTSANQETETDLYLVRNRSREQTRNNPHAKRAIQAISTNTIGTGIRPAPKIKAKAKAQRIKEAFNEWADNIDCDWDGQANFYGLQRLIMRAIAQDGEVIVRKRWVVKEDGSVPLQLQVLEIDHLDQNKNSLNGFNLDKNNPHCIQGVQFNSQGKREGYWLYPSHPAEGYVSQSVLIPADEILHVYYKERPGQVRGVPFGASASLSLFDFDEFERAQLMRQKIAACFAVFIQDNDATTLPSGGGSTAKDFEGEKVVPGMIRNLPAGKTVTLADPPGVNGYDEYTSAMLRKIAVGFGVSYEVLTGDLSNVNFSSGRMGWLEFHRLISEWQTLMLIPMLCNPVWNWYCEAAEIVGKGKRGTKVTWTPPRREMIDPVKEIKAMTDAIRAGLGSWSDAVRQLGNDPDDLLDEICTDFKNQEDKELMLTCNPKYDATRSNGALPSEDEEGVDGNGEELTGKQKKAAKKQQITA